MPWRVTIEYQCNDAKLLYREHDCDPCYYIIIGIKRRFDQHHFKFHSQLQSLPSKSRNVFLYQSFTDVLQNRCSWKIKTPVLESLFTKVANLEAWNFIRKRIQHKCFPVKFEKILRARFFTEHLRWVLLGSTTCSRTQRWF